MRPKKIFLIRHGQSFGNVDKEIYKTVPDYALQLTDLGKAQAITAGKKLRSIIGDETIKFYVSPFWRTRQTYDGIIKAFDINKTSKLESPLLREQEWHGKLPISGYSNADEMERDNYGHFYYRFNGGESVADTFDRASDFLNSLFRDFEKVNYPDNAIIVTHGMALRVFLMRFFHYTVEEFEKLANPENCQIVLLEKNDVDKYVLKTELKSHTVKHNYQYIKESL